MLGSTPATRFDLVKATESASAGRIVRNTPSSVVDLVDGGPPTRGVVFTERHREILRVMVARSICWTWLGFLGIESWPWLVDLITAEASTCTLQHRPRPLAGEGRVRGPQKSGSYFSADPYGTEIFFSFGWAIVRRPGNPCTPFAPVC